MLGSFSQLGRRSVLRYALVRIRRYERWRSVVRRLLDVDFLFICTDSHGSRAVLNELCYQYLIPAIDVGVVVSSVPAREPRLHARIQMLAPGLACLSCSRVLNPERVRQDLQSPVARAAEHYGLGDAAVEPAVMSLNGVAASLAVTMALSALTGMASPSRAQLVRFDRGDLRSLDSGPRDSCMICRVQGRLGAGDSFEEVGMPDQIDVAQGAACAR